MRNAADRPSLRRRPCQRPLRLGWSGRPLHLLSRSHRHRASSRDCCRRSRCLPSLRPGRPQGLQKSISAFSVSCPRTRIASAPYGRAVPASSASDDHDGLRALIDNRRRRSTAAAGRRTLDGRVAAPCAKAQRATAEAGARGTTLLTGADDEGPRGRADGAGDAPSVAAACGRLGARLALSANDDVVEADERARQRERRGLAGRCTASVSVRTASIYVRYVHVTVPVPSPVQRSEFWAATLRLSAQSDTSSASTGAMLHPRDSETESTTSPHARPRNSDLNLKCRSDSS